MADFTYLNRENIREEARYFFEQDFPNLIRGTQEYNQYFGVYRHIYGSAVLTRDFGETIANGLGQINEFDFFGLRNNPQSERSQDLQNNIIGRNIGLTKPIGDVGVLSGRAIADQIQKVFRSGEVILDANTTNAFSDSFGQSSSLLVTNQNTVQKNFNSLGINTTNFDITKNSFSNFTFIDTSIKFDSSKFTNAGYNPSGSLNSFNFQISNPIQSEQFGNYTWIMIGVTNS